MKILNIEPACYNQLARELLDSLGKVDYIECRDAEELKSLFDKTQYDVLMVGLGIHVGSEIMQISPNLKWIATPTTGLTHIDEDFAANQGIEVLSLKGETSFLENIHTTAEHCWALLLSLVRYLPNAHKDVVDGYWRRVPFQGNELNGKTIGLLGCGRLGRKVARYSLTFGMKVYGLEVSEESKAKTPEGVEFVDLDFLLSESDIVSIHLPCDETTKGFLSKERINQMKRGSILINTARGELVDEAALLDALKSGHIHGAGLDVLNEDASWGERVPIEHPLVSFAKDGGNLILTPHIGGYTLEPVETTRLFITQKLLQKIRN